jgi:hypothetical protein
MTARFLMLASIVAIAGCASTRPSGELAQARAIHQGLVSSGADRRVEADILRTNTAIAEAEAAFSTRKHQSDIDALGHIALRLAQTAEANNARLLAERVADSLRTARLQRLLTLSEIWRRGGSYPSRRRKRSVSGTTRCGKRPRRRTAG